MTPSSPREAEVAEKRRYWKQHIDTWRNSGLTQVGYCRKHDLSRYRFQYWKKRFHPTEPSASFIEIPLSPNLQQGHPPQRLCLVVGGRFQIAIERDFDPVALKQLLGVLEQW